MPSEHRSGSSGGAVTGRLGINAHLLSGEAGYRRAGIHQYIAQVLRHLPWEEGEPTYVVFTQQKQLFADLPGITAVSSRLPTDKRLLRILWEQIVWPWQLWQNRVDLLHSMAFVTPLFSRCPAVITVYDLSFYHFPERFPALQRLYLSSQTRRSCQRARRIITISESSRQDVHRFLGVPLEWIDVVVPGVDAVYRPLPPDEVAAFRQRQGLERFVLHVGTLQPRKNIPVLIDAFARQDDPELKLVLVGGKGWLYDEIFRQVQALGLADRVIFTGYVPDDDLPLWYNAAELLVFPSVYEGFGLPVVEAMACGTPVIASNSSSIPEAVGEAGLLFAPNDVETLASQMTAVLTDTTLKNKLRQQGLEHAQTFSWARAGLETAVVYQRALQKK
ncbi:MAG: glycosyltransferase family 4 protein [Ardenticatenaceae bacterium]|nr:glycosyltransferase family 4 protein [Anaerolineales bacterium]MCB8938451.1 glycosyltransferase family 4 protein [Ardenticatenaceae bacterium]MCB8975236.1 glycosyltransferase family 4 protein [Ardenticatenaceae bacterium]